MPDDESVPVRRGPVARMGRYLALLTYFIVDRALEAGRENARIIISEFGLFLGAVTLLIGILGFESDRYCDGNTAQYLSCTRPATYYYYDSLDIALIVFGVLCIVLWFLKRSR